MSDPAIVFDNVDKYYPLYHHITGGMKNFLLHLKAHMGHLRKNRFEALKGVSFTVDQGETLGVIGRNGAGKSTILGLVAGVLKPTKGTVKVNGRVSPMLELGAGFHPDLSGRENIVLNGVLMGLTRERVYEKLDSIIEFSDLGNFIDQPIRVYSTGMLARLGFSVVANLDPEILLIDEVLAVGDSDFQDKCLQTMYDFKKSGVTIIFVSHWMEAVRQICDRVILIEDHQVAAAGLATKVTLQYEMSG